jgi:hypothetical protein
MASNCIGNSNDLLGASVFKTALDEKVAETVDHQRIRLADDRPNDVVFLFSRADFELLLQENGRLLIVVADYLVHDVFPIA